MQKTSHIQNFFVFHQDYFPTPASLTCQYYVNTFGSIVIELFDKALNPDEVCNTLDFCTDQTCKMYPDRSSGKSIQKVYVKGYPPTFDPWQWFIDILERVGHHEPDLDLDGDLFSTEPILRGSDWRGRDW